VFVTVACEMGCWDTTKLYAHYLTALITDESAIMSIRNKEKERPNQNYYCILMSLAGSENLELNLVA